MSEHQLTTLSKLVLFAILVIAVGFILVVIGLVLPPTVGRTGINVGGNIVYFPNGTTDPNPLQLPFLVAGAVVLVGGLGFLALQLFKHQPSKVPTGT